LLCPDLRALNAYDAAMMMLAVKLSRMRHGAYNPDNYIDAAAYVAIAAEIRAGQAFKIMGSAHGSKSATD